MWPGARFQREIGKIKWLRYLQLSSRVEVAFSYLLPAGSPSYLQFVSVVYLFLPLEILLALLRGLGNKIWSWSWLQWPTCLSLPGTVLILAPKDAHPRKTPAVVPLLSRVHLFCDPVDCGTPGSSVPEDFQARILEWVAISFSMGSSQTRDQTCVSCIGWWILYHWVAREAQETPQSQAKGMA